MDVEWPLPACCESMAKGRRGGHKAALTKAAGDDLRTILRKDEGIHERQIHRGAPTAPWCRDSQAQWAASS
jgi:hypothetical protein